MIIAIDGPAASGKSTTARLVAARLGFTYLDTGAMYRAVTWHMLQTGFNPAVEMELAKLCDSFRYRLELTPGCERHFVGESDVTGAIRTPAVTTALRRVTPVPAIRRFLVDQQRQLAADQDVVLDGRDIGTVVFPQAELKIFLIASLEVRAERRAAEMQARGWPTDLAEIKATIVARDRDDTQRQEGPLLQAADAVPLDTSDLTIEQQVEAILQMVADLEQGR